MENMYMQYEAMVYQQMEDSYAYEPCSTDSGFMKEKEKKRHCKYVSAPADK